MSNWGGVWALLGTGPEALGAAIAAEGVVAAPAEPADPVDREEPAEPEDPAVLADPAEPDDWTRPDPARLDPETPTLPELELAVAALGLELGLKLGPLGLKRSGTDDRGWAKGQGCWGILATVGATVPDPPLRPDPEPAPEPDPDPDPILDPDPPEPAPDRAPDAAPAVELPRSPDP